MVEVSDPDELVDRLYHDCRKRGEPCVFLSFSPPHRTPIHHACPTIPVFAWEFSTLPSETWHGEPRHDWRHVLRHSGRAITHSSFTVDVVRAAMGRDYPVLSVPAPVWDRFANRASQQAGRPEARDVRLRLDGLLVDSRQLDLAVHADPEPSAEVLALPDRAAKQVELSLDGVIYTSVFNPYDGRKNWQDMISAFCATFRDEPDATLVLKLTHHNVGEALADMLHHLYKNQSYRCRIVLIHGYLADPDYERLVEATSYVVNTSYGEGQCLPLMEFMSSGKPAVAPRNTAMIDYIDADNAFIVDSSEEATAWPHDPRAAYRTLRYITDWESLCRAYRASFEVARQEPERYARMSAHASASLERFCSRKLAVERLRRFLDEAAQGDPPPCKASRHDPRPAPTLAFPSRCGERTGVATHVRSARCGAGWLVPQRNRRTARRLRHRRPGHPARSRLRRRRRHPLRRPPGRFGDLHRQRGQGAEPGAAGRGGGPEALHGLVSDSDPLLPLRDACADKLVCMEVLEHVANPARVMAELVRLGRPGAQYLLSVPDPVGEHLQQGIAPADYFRAPNHIHIFSATTSRAWCRTPGWSSSTARPAASSG